MKLKESNSVIQGALLLTIAGMFSKILSAGYRIPLQNLTGDLGFYIYQQIYPLLGIGMILSLYGFPVAVSKIVAERKQGKLRAQFFYLPILFLLIGINFFFFAFLFFFAPVLAHLVGDVELQSSFRYVAFIFLLIPFTSILRGSLQGQMMMYPTAISQVCEQLIRIILIIASAYLVARQFFDPYAIGKLGALASILGSICALIVLWRYFPKTTSSSTVVKESIPWKKYSEIIFLFGIIGSLHHMILLFMQGIDVITLVPQLIKYGYSLEDAKLLKGVFDRGQPLIQLGTVIGSSFALAIVPSIDRGEKSSTDRKEDHALKLALSVTLYISLAAAIGLLLIFPEVNRLLYKDDAETFSLQILSIAIFFSPLTITLASILQARGHFKKTAQALLFACILKVCLNLYLVPIFGITGSALATVISLAFLIILLYRRMKRLYPRLNIFEKVKYFPTLIAIIGLFISVKAMQWMIPQEWLEQRLFLLLSVLSIVSVGAFTYIFLLVRYNAFTKIDLMNLPFSAVFLRIYKGGNLDES